ncbi:hypothetical protein [Microbacterium maritypicum]|uniref:hypothetical protein n=1 Tax=Microbacterium maritypicum TaxID=33918 RepID=UPI0037F3B160
MTVATSLAQTADIDLDEAIQLAVKLENAAADNGYTLTACAILASMRDLKRAGGRNPLEAMRAIQNQRAALAARQDELLKQLLSELEWMDVPVRRLRGMGVLTIVSDATFGTRVHLVRQYQENGPYDNTSAHLTDDCGWYCAGPGKTVKGGGRERWRYLCEGEFEYIGSTDTDGHTDYLFSPVTP